MKRILHLVDGSFGWEQGAGLNPLRSRLTIGHTHLVAGWGRPVNERFLPRREVVRHFQSCGVADPLAGQSLARWVTGQGVDLVHAWGSRAGIAAMTHVQGGVPVVTTLFDPLVADRHARALRSLTAIGGHAVICSAATVRRRLVERGLDAESCVVVRPGVDFGAINQYRRQAEDWRAKYGAGAMIITTAHAGMEHGGQDVAAHAALTRRYVDPRIRMVVPGLRTNGDFKVRWIMGSDYPDTLISNEQLRSQLGGSGSFEQLLPLADVLLLPVGVEISTTSIAWAMASSVLIIAGAVYSTSELLSHQHNALLLKPTEPKFMAFKVASMLGDLSLATRLTDTARGQAFEVFSQRRYLDQVARVYLNLLEGRRAGDGLTDPALVA